MSSWRRWTAFAVWSVVVMSAAPYANDIQGWISERFGEGALRLGLSVLLVAATTSFAVLLIRRRESSDLKRLVWLAGLATAAFVLMWRLHVAAEPVHLALYGILGALAFRALAVHYPDHGVYFAAATLTAIVGNLDEIVQWLLPQRFWDIGDVGLNVSAGIMVQLVIWKVVRPTSIAPGTSPRSLRVATRLAICEVVLLLLCISNTPKRIDGYASRLPSLEYLGKGQSTIMNEYGHRHTDPEIGSFLSRLSKEELLAFDREHGAEVAKVLDDYREVGYGKLQRANPPSRAPFTYEAIGHVFFRQRFWGQARRQEDPEKQTQLATAAFRENLILERYFSKSLGRSDLAVKPQARQWLEARNRPQDEFESRSSEWLLTGYSEAQARWFLLLLLAGLIAAERVCSQKLKAETS